MVFSSVIFVWVFLPMEYIYEISADVENTDKLVLIGVSFRVKIINYLQMVC